LLVLLLLTPLSLRIPSSNPLLSTTSSGKIGLKPLRLRTAELYWQPLSDLH
jgi:hypothetical protein